ncbi:hypothetical protein CU098_005466 [Rhizopus stolonifer]|uniref:NADH:flavin oxidoreductase/NADH oxidase N-terminal domain-containing protein n=1 Tax=Rhizopus stolonifer TaxID=4846 RepID=A0A367JY18_RHIST|nr:hypothetical protein CU098_005466 [Rhizopus stolonifer]
MVKLFEPISIGQYKLQHRVVLAPLTRKRATAEGVPTDLMVEHYRQRTSVGGLLISEACFVNPVSRGYSQVPGIFTEEQIDAWKKVTDAVHEKGGIIFAQIWHAGRAGSPKLNPNNEPTVSASAVHMPGKDDKGNDRETPHALEIHEIKEIVQDFKQAALNSIQAGFDGVEIHNANGYLLDQFLNSHTNRRTDEYNGSPEKKARFTLEVVEAVVSAIGPEKTAIRFSPGGTYNDVHDKDPLTTWSYVTNALQERFPQLAYLHFIEPRSTFFGDAVNTIDSLGPFRKLWNGPFINSGGFSNAIQHAVNIAEGTNDLIAFGRMFISNPDLPERIKNNIPLTKYDRSTFYKNDAVGYNDYPSYSQQVESRL